MTTNYVIVVSDWFTAPCAGNDCGAVLAGVGLAAAWFLTGAAFRLLQRSFGGWEAQ